MSNEMIVFLLIIGTGLVMAVIVMPTWLAFRQGGRHRELEHMERMKALELGRSLPGESPASAESTSAWIAWSIGAVVPIGVFGCAWLASQSVGYHESMWLASGMVGTAGVICGTILAYQSFHPENSSSRLDAAKPLIEEDAYDVASARG